MPTPPYPLRSDETFTIVQDGYSYHLEFSTILDAMLVTRGLLPALTPSFATLAGAAAVGTLLATITGLLSGETIERILPDDARLAINAARTGVVKGAAPAINGTKDYTLVTTKGRRLPFQVTTTGAPS